MYEHQAAFCSALIAYLITKKILDYKISQHNKTSRLERRISEVSFLEGGSQHFSQKLWRWLLKVISPLENKYSAQINLKLSRAGIILNQGWLVFYILSAASALIVGLATILYLGPLLKLPFATQLILPIIGGCTGYLIPEYYLKLKTRERYSKIAESTPDLLDILVICTQAGISFEKAITRASLEMRNNYQATADELWTTALQTEMLDLPQALNNLAQRCQLPILERLKDTVLQSSKYGISVNKTLLALAEDFRKENLLKAEERAARLPTLMTLPLMGFMLPVIFITLIGPIVIKALG